MGYANGLAVRIKELERLLDAERERVGIGPGSRLSVNVLDERRARLAVYAPDFRCVAEYECLGESDRAGTNVQLIAKRSDTPRNSHCDA